MKATITKATREEKRALMEQAAASGRVFAVEFVKKDKTVRKMQCKKYVNRHFAHGPDNVGVNTCAHKPELFTVSDVGAADAFRNINLDTLISLNFNGNQINFEEE